MIPHPRDTGAIAKLGITVLAAIAWTGAALAQPPSEIPDPALTPGVVASTDAAEVCGKREGLTYSQRHRATTQHMKEEVFRRYGIDPQIGRAQEWEIDHRGPLCSGFADVLENLWAQPGNGLGARFTFHDKDKLEAHACRAVCSGAVPLAVAQSWFLAPDWRVPFCQIIGGPPC